MSRHLTFRFAILAATASLGCSTTIPPTGSDGGVGDMAIATTDMPPAPVRDMAVATLTGTSIFMGQGLQLAGVTSDDWIVYLDNKNGANAVSLAGGMSQSLTKSNTTYSDVKVVGSVVFASANLDMDNNGDLVVWSSSTKAAAKLNVKGASRNFVSYASADGQYILYSDGASTSATDIYLAKADGSGAKLVFAGIAVNTMCGVQLGFASGKFLVAHCVDGDTLATISTVNPADGTVKDIRKNTRDFFSTDKAGTQVFVVEAAISPVDDGGLPVDGGTTLPSKAYVMNIDGSNAILIDTDVFYGFPQADGKGVIYGTNKPELKRTPLPTIAPLSLTTTHFAGFATGQDGTTASSPDGKYTITISASTGGISDLYLASTTVPGTPATLSSKATGCLFSDAFTTDSSHALFYTSCANANGLVVGTFQTAAVTGGAPVMLGTKVWNDYATGKPAQVLFNDNWKSQKNTNGRADLKVADVSAAMPTATLIVSQAEADFFLNHAKDKVIFAYAVDATKAGIYTAPIP